MENSKEATLRGHELKEIDDRMQKFQYYAPKFEGE